MNMGLFENAIRSAIAFHNPSPLYCKAMILTLDLITLSNMGDFNYSDRLAVAIYTTKQLLLERINHLEEIEDDEYTVIHQ